MGKISFAAIALLVCASAASARIPVLLSTDIGNEIDDQWAVAYLLTTPEFEVVGITSAHGPSLPSPSAHYTYKVLLDEVENRLNMNVHPPLVEGGSIPLKNLTTPQSSAAVDFIIASSKAYSKENRLNLLVIGAATDAASAILQDPSIVDRINIVSMGFKNLGPEGGKEFNIQNDPKAWQVILNSSAPVTIGSGDVCRAYLSLNYAQAAALLSGHGPVADWLWMEYQEWYFRNIKPLRVDDYSKSWVIWDIITLAHLRGLATSHSIKRPALSDDLSLEERNSNAQAVWIDKVDSSALWKEFIVNLDHYTQTHAVATRDR